MINQTIKKYYRRTDVRFEIVKQLYRREFAVLKPSYMDQSKKNMRMLRCHNLNHFDYIMQYLKFFSTDNFYNFYKSLATYYNGIPIQKLNYTERGNGDWKQTHFKEMGSYDLMIDIDAGDHNDIQHAQYSAQIITEFYNKLNVPYYLIFSGKGFHIITPGNYFNKSKNIIESDNIYFLYSAIARYLYNNFSELVDTGIYDPRRLCKLAYSLAIYDDSVYVAYPLNYYVELDDFRLKEYNLNGFDKPVTKRGMMLFNEKGNVKQLEGVVVNGKEKV